jgi:hypothetical protein
MKTITLLSLLILTVAAGFSCVAPLAPFTGSRSSAAGESATEVPDDFEELRLEVRGLVSRGDLPGADALLAIALGQGRSREEKIDIRALRREVRKEQFRDVCPLEFEIWSPRNRYTADETIALEFRMHNRSARTLRIPSAGSWGWLPFTESRHSFVQARVSASDVSAANGFVTGGSWNELLEIDGTLEIGPGSFHAIPFSLSPSAADGLLYRRLHVEGNLMPGGLEVGEFDYGLIHFQFPGKAIHVFADAGDWLPAATGDDLKRVLAAGEALPVFKTAVLIDQAGLREAIDMLVDHLPSLPSGTQRLAMAALCILSRENLGFDRTRWIEWWRMERSRMERSRTERSRTEGSRRVTPPPPDEGHRPPGEPPPEQEAGSSGAVVQSLDGALLASVFLACRSEPFFLPAHSDEEPDAIREALRDRYYGRRYGAIHNLVFGAEESIPRIEGLIGDSDPLVRKGCVEALGGIGGDPAGRILTAVLAGESDDTVRQAIIQALGLLGIPLSGGFEAGVPEGGGTILGDLYADRRLMVAMEDVMHEGTIPGFYDGQFAAFWEIGPDLPARLLRIAHDPECQHSVRVLAIMSLSELRAPTLEKDLKPLIMPPREELTNEWLNYKDLRLSESLTELMIEEGRELKLSGYSRYSLAKAGINRYVLAKITEMKRWIDREKVTVDERGTFKGLFGTRLVLKQEFSRNLFFDVGYEYHQLDDYEKSESWYLRLIRRFPDSFSLSNAHYNLACIYSLLGRCEESLHQLSLCVQEGFLDFSWMEKDRDLENVRRLPGYKALKKEVIEGEGGGSEEENPEKQDLSGVRQKS